MTDTDEHNLALCDELRDAGVAEAQITLALETSQMLLDQLASTPLDGRHKRAVRELFQRYAPAGE